jgi:hypothetical protein
VLTGCNTGAHEAKRIAISKAIITVFVFIDAYVFQGTAQRFALPALGRETAKPSDWENAEA